MSTAPSSQSDGRGGRLDSGQRARAPGLFLHHHYRAFALAIFDPQNASLCLYLCIAFRFAAGAKEGRRGYLVEVI